VKNPGVNPKVTVGIAAVLSLLFMTCFIAIGYEPPPSREAAFSKYSASESSGSSSSSAGGYSIPGVPRPPEGFKTTFANLYEGTELYLVSDETYIGTVVGFEDDHQFPDGTEHNGVLIRFADGSSDWVPRKTVQRIYVTK
jgi:hypothetical protein